MPKITLTDGDFGQGPAAADIAAFHLPDPLRPGSTLVVPLTDVTEMALIGSDNTHRIKSAIRSGIGGLLSAGPAGLSAGLLAAGKAPHSVFSVRLRDGRGFTALADAAVFADLHATQVEAARAERDHPADRIIHRYIAGEAVAAPVTAPPPVTVPASPAEAAPAAAVRLAPATSFGRRPNRPV